MFVFAQWKHLLVSDAVYVKVITNTERAMLSENTHIIAILDKENQLVSNKKNCA